MAQASHLLDTAWLQEQLSRLNRQQRPRWGMMTPQHMVEHLRFAFQLSTGKIHTQVFTPAEKVEKYKQYGLLSEQPFAENYKNPLLPRDTQPPLLFADLPAARQALLEEVSYFHHFYKQQPEAVFPHPVFGQLNSKEWMLFHTKHIHHHFRQFGLIQEVH